VCFIGISCEKEVSIPIPEKEPKLVVDATLVPYSLPNAKYLGVNVTSSRHIFDSTTDTQITDATVLLYKNSVFVDTLKYSSENDVNFFPLGYGAMDGPKAGETFQIKVSSPGYEAVNAETFIPNYIEILDLSIDRVAFFDDENLVYSKLTLTFHDPVDEINFYEIVASGIGYEYIPENYYRLTTYEPIITGESHYPPSIRFDLKKPKYLLFKDNTINGQEIEMDFYFFARQINTAGTILLLPDIISIQLRNLTEEYYNYRSTLLQSSYNLQEDILYGMGEPLNVYSNVENGYGIFAGYNNSIKTLELDELDVR
jgi:hypothetical protein